MKQMKTKWQAAANEKKADFITDLQMLLRIPSVLDENDSKPGAPFGENVNQALQFMIDLGKREGFRTKDLEGYAAYLEWGEGEELLGVLCHVDVVPEGDNWDMPPFSAEIKDGRIYARGAQDDKGPTMAAFYALKILKEMDIPFEKRVRIILGADEESGFRCVKKYFAEEEMPTIGFAPDASFPMIYAEKGISDAIFTMPSITKEIVAFEGGQRLNMVPDYASAKICGIEISEADFLDFCQAEKVEGSLAQEGSKAGITLSLKGVSAHGSEPQRGQNAVTLLAKFLSRYISDQGLALLSKLHGDFYGEQNGFAMADHIAGPLTLNVGQGILKENEWTIGANIRYPVTKSFEEVKDKMKDLATQYQCQLTSISDKAPLYIPEDHPLVQTLLRVYEEQTGRKDPLETTGGGTYARELKVGLAFGALFPGEEELYHQRNESASIDGLLKAIAIYTAAIYELACKK